MASSSAAIAGRNEVKADQEKAGRQFESAGIDRRGQCLRQLRGADVSGAEVEAFEGARPVSEGAGIGRAGRGAQAPLRLVGVQARPRTGGELCERVKRSQCRIARSGGNDRMPKRVLLRPIEEKLCGVSVQQKAMPQRGEPRVPRKNCRGRPVGESQGLLPQLECVAEGACRALIACKHCPAARQCVGGGLRQRSVRIHRAVIPCARAEKESAERAAFLTGLVSTAKYHG